MPASKNSRVKDSGLYEKLREEGNSQEKSARLAESGSYDNWTVTELKKCARELGLTNYSKKKKSELVSMLRDH